MDVGLGLHKDSNTFADSLDAGEVGLLDKPGTTGTDVGCVFTPYGRGKRHVCVVCEAGPCGYGPYCQFAQSGFGCMICALAVIPRKSGKRVKADQRDAIILIGLPSCCAQIPTCATSGCAISKTADEWGNSQHGQ